MLTLELYEIRLHSAFDTVDKGLPILCLVMRKGTKMFKSLACMLLVCTVLITPVQAHRQPEEPYHISYAEALHKALHELPAIRDIDAMIREVRLERRALQDFRRFEEQMGASSRDELARISRQISDLDDYISTLQLNEEMVRIGIEFSLRSAITDIANMRLDLQLMELALEQEQAAFNRARLRFNTGLISRNEFTSAETALQYQKSELAALRILLEAEQQNLNRILQQPITSSFCIYFDRELIELPGRLNNHIQQMIRRQPCYRRLEMAVNRARVQRRYAVCDRDFYGVDTRDERTRAYNQAVRERNEARRNLETAIRGHFNTLTVLLRQNEALEVELQQAMGRYEAILLRYRAGMVRSPEVEAVRFAVIKAEIALEQHLNKFWNAQFLFEHPFLLVA